jgi:hypothetical protein
VGRLRHLDPHPGTEGDVAGDQRTQLYRVDPQPQRARTAIQRQPYRRLGDEPLHGLIGLGKVRRSDNRMPAQDLGVVLGRNPIRDIISADHGRIVTARDRCA